jgi:thiol-disulfide isomerase/thioredoxin
MGIRVMNNIRAGVRGGRGPSGGEVKQSHAPRKLLRCLWATALALGLLHPSYGVAVGVQDRLPPLQVMTPDGDTTVLSAEPGKLTYVDFWASWCAPCQESLPWMNTLVEKYGARGLRVVAISVDKDRASAERTLKRVVPQYPVYFDPEGVSAKALQLPAMPTSYLVRDDGTVVRVVRGFRSSDKAAIEAEIDSLLGAP